MAPNTQKVFGTLNINKVWLPVLLSMGVVLYLIASDNGLQEARLDLIRDADWRYLLLTVVMVLVRNGGYMQRLRVLTHQKLRWQRSFYVTVLWEFASAVTPSVSGGGVVAVFLLLKEGIRLGQSLAYVIVTTVFDSLFFLLVASVGFWGTYDPIFSEASLQKAGLGGSLQVLFWSSYVLVALYTIVMLSALWIWPQFFQWALVKVTRLSLLKRWQQAAQRHGNDLVLASQALQGEPLSYWLKIGGSTLAIWMSRYLLLNCIMAAYISLNVAEHGAILGKQVVMWTLMLVSPTPGSCGTAEFFYKQLYGELLGHYALMTNVLWRVMTYYLYLIVGAICLPRWIKQVFSSNNSQPVQH